MTFTHSHFGVGHYWISCIVHPCDSHFDSLLVALASLLASFSLARQFAFIIFSTTTTVIGIATAAASSPTVLLAVQRGQLARPFSSRQFHDVIWCCFFLAPLLASLTNLWPDYYDGITIEMELLAKLTNGQRVSLIKSIQRYY